MGQNCIVGYHGTSKSCADKILAERSFRPSKKANEWLGKGIYFFDDRRHAIGWANVVARNRKEQTSVVLAVDITFQDEDIFDIDNPETLLVLNDFYENALKDGVFRNGAPRFKDNNQLRCFVANFYKDTHPNIKIVAYTFDSTQTTSIGFSIKQRQLCVSESSIDVLSNIRCVYTQITGKGGYYRG